jgi:hypothetical protein
MSKKQTGKIQVLILELKYKFNNLVKAGMHEQAIGLNYAIELLEQFNLEKQNGQETNDREND